MKSSNQNSVNKSFDEKFVEAFADKISSMIKDDNNIKSSLLFATLREYIGFSTTSKPDKDPYSISTVYCSMMGRFHEVDISQDYRKSPKADRNTLTLYLKNLTQIQEAVLGKIEKYPDLTDVRKLELQTSANEAFKILQGLKSEILQDVVKLKHNISAGEIIYGRKDDGTAKVIMNIKDLGKYCGDVVEHSSISSQLPTTFPEGYIEMQELRRDNPLKTSSTNHHDQGKKNEVEKKMHGKGIIYYNNGNEYEGEFAQGEWHGNGRIKWKRKGMYEGEFANGRMSGKGTFTWRNGDTYQGECITPEEKMTRVINEGIFTSKSSGKTVTYNFPKGYSASLDDVILIPDKPPSNSQVKTSFEMASPLTETSNVPTR